MKKYFVYGMLFGGALVLSGCGGGGGSQSAGDQPPAVFSTAVSSASSVSSVSSMSSVSFSASSVLNKAPVVNAGGNLEVYESQQVNIHAIASDADGSISNYLWQQMNGNELPLSVVNSTDITFVAPNVQSDSVFQIKLTVTDNALAVASDTLRLTIKKLPATGYIKGKVVQLNNGAAISNAKISIEGMAVNSDAQGGFSISELPLHKRLVMTIAKAGFVTQQRIITAENLLALDGYEVHLLPVGLSQTIDAGAAVDIELPDGKVSVSLESNSVVRSDGAPISTPITANLTFIDPSLNRSIMPGDYSVEGSSDLLESFGAFALTFTDADGAALRLTKPATFIMSSVTATLGEFPPATIPTYFYNEALGRWVVQPSSATTSPLLFGMYQGTIMNAGTHNLDRPMGVVKVSGCVKDDDGRPVANAVVQLASTNRLNTFKAISDVNGQWFLQVATPSSFTVNATANGSNTQLVTLTTRGADVAMTGCLIASKPSVSIELVWETNPMSVIPSLLVNTATLGSFELPRATLDVADDWLSAPFARFEQIDYFGKLTAKASIKKFIDGEYVFSAIIAGSASLVPVSKVHPSVIVTIDGVTKVISAPATLLVDNAKWEPFKITFKNGDYSLVETNTWVKFSAD